MIKKENFIKTDEKYGSGIGIDVYKNEINICTAHEGKDGQIFPQWVFPQGKDRKPIETAIPHKISLGVKQQAIQRIEQLLLMIERL
jgi:hypothetical protein